MYITKTVYEQIKQTVGAAEPERGGVLGGSDKQIISEFFFDSSETVSSIAYTPDIEKINHVLTNDWMPRGIWMLGIVHSHANGNNVPSCGDIHYGIQILQALDTVERFLIPIVTWPEKKFCLTCYAVYQDAENGYICKKVDYTLIEERRNENETKVFADSRDV